MQKLSEYVPSMKTDGYSFEFLTLYLSTDLLSTNKNSLLSARNFSLALVIRLSLTYSLNLEIITIKLHVW